MQTVQRHASPYIPPWTSQWSKKRRLGFGLFSLVPLLLLGALFVSLFGNMITPGFETDTLPILFYTHVGVQFIVLLVFGHLMLSNPRLTGRGRAAWALLFLFAAPFSIPVYWIIHVWNEQPNMPDEQTPHTKLERHVHVYDYDYTGRDAIAQGGRTEQRTDGAVIHHVDATS